MNPSNRRSRRRRSPRPFAVLLIAGGAGVLGYNFWQSKESDGSQDDRQAGPTNAPALVEVNEQDQPSEIFPLEPIETTTPQALAEVVEPEASEPVRSTAVPTEPVVPAESNSDAPPAVRERALADFASGMRLLKDGLGVEGRQRLSDALGSGGLDEARASEVRVALAQLSETLVFGSGVAQRDPFAREFIIPEGGVLAKIAQNQTNGLHWKFLARINGISSPNRIRSGQRLKLLDGPFHAVVDKSAYRLDLWMGQEDDRVYVRSFNVGLGRDNRTPEGQFQVSSRVENPQHTDPETGKIFDKNDPLNPVGEHWIAIKGTEPATEKLSGFGLHGTIDENSIGRSESLGCVRMLPDDIALLYEVLGPGRSEIELRP
ncbi:MAG: L,D-transpeptidase [Phycisphaerales bacterium]|nr:L,D-transpeptidase [Phycisphaerales bacterium]MEC8386461.1 L,D-transpeptidase [Planctomycetota bacterium]